MLLPFGAFSRAAFMQNSEGRFSSAILLKENTEQASSGYRKISQTIIFTGGFSLSGRAQKEC